MSDCAVRFEGVGKMYRLGQVGTGTLCHDLNQWWQTRILGRENPYLKVGGLSNLTTKNQGDCVWALRDISLDINQGETVGIIGRNGAGKSTLLKLLSRITTPTTGCIKARGRITSMLEVGTGFHPEMTGRENIYMNGAIMGMKRREIARRFDEIVDFAGIERYVDTPVKRYSSGMWVRLGFAVAAFLESDILVVDEVLAVGDAEFQRKAIGKLEYATHGQGRTVLFVSHNMGAVAQLCRRGIVIDRGHVVADGEINQAIEAYMSRIEEDQIGEIRDAIKRIHKSLLIDQIKINDTTSRQSILAPGQETLRIEIRGSSRQEMKCSIKLIFKTMAGLPVASLVEGRVKGETIQFVPGEFNIECEVILPRYLAKGDFLIDLYLHQPTVQDFFYAPNCAILHSYGGCQEYGAPVVLADEGFMSLECESIKVKQPSGALTLC
ncbi:MAG: polysaccharide ABC transporter ATP-binding protein [Bacteroidales bacterium]|nr:polysaccharide ABC transporter ATP-binding protein [Bacteroidales bacterium]